MLGFPTIRSVAVVYDGDRLLVGGGQHFGSELAGPLRVYLTLV